MLNLLCFWVLQIPLAWLLAFRIGWGVNGIFAAIPVAQSTLAVAGMLLFRRGKWKGAMV
jgi:Na+-driven multidrug efflux pump